MKRRSFCAMTAALPLATTLYAHAQGTGEVVTIVVPFPAGGTSDAFARVLAPGLSSRLKRNVVIENLSGASGSLAAQKALARGKTGDTLILASPTELILAPATIASAKYKSSDFRLLGLISKVPLGVYVRADLPVNNVDELVAHMKLSSNKPLSYGSVGVGSVYHLATEEFASAAGVRLNHIPYRGGAPMWQDLMGGQIDLALAPADGHQGARVATGKVRIIGITGMVRSPAFPSTPTTSESRTLSNFRTVDVWGGLFVAASAPEAIVQALHEAMRAALADPELRKSIEKTAGAELVPAMGLPELSRFLAAETTKFNLAAKSAKLEMN